MAYFRKVMMGGFRPGLSQAVRYTQGDMIKTVKLSNGSDMPAIGLGTWQSQPGEVRASVSDALSLGYNHIDCAHVYYNEEEIGGALNKAFTSGLCSRKEVWVTSKLWCYDYAPEDVMAACERTLSDLKVPYLDLYLLHWPVRLRKGAAKPGEPMNPDDLLGYSKEMIAETWHEMEKLVAKGLTRNIGVSNFSQKKLKELLDGANMKPAVHQVECHPYFQQHEMKKLCKEEDIQFQSYSPLGSPDRPARNREVDAPVVMDDPVLKSIAQRLKCSVAQVAIAWQYQLGVPQLVKSVSHRRIAENLAAKNIHLDDQAMKDIASIDRNVRLLYGRWGFRPNQTPQDFWDGENVISQI